MTDWASILQQLGVTYWTEGKNVAEGCVNIQCVYCDDHSNHGGFDCTSGRYRCWRCGSHFSLDALCRAGGINMQKAKELVNMHGGLPSVSTRTRKVASASDITLPGGKLMPMHVKYLEGRGFDPEELEFYHGIKGTSYLDRWQGIDFRLRVIIPCYDVDGSVVTFQGRDITGKQELRYKCCPVEKAIKHHKHTLYGAELCTHRRRICVVEGVFDAWRLGQGAVATFGTSVTREQIALMAQWEQIVIAFDPEDEAQSHAREIAMELSAMGRQVVLARADFGVNADGSIRDAGDISKDDAEAFMREIGMR